MGDTKIIYADKGWSPIVGCTPVSEGCEHCWARTLHNQRHRAQQATATELAEAVGQLDVMGKGHAQHVRALAGYPFLNPKLPLPPQYDLPFEVIQLRPDRLDEPLHWRKPRTVFAAPMSDWLHPEVSDEFIYKMLGVMAIADKHTFLTLTKRPERLLGMDMLYFNGKEAVPLPNVWLGVTVENQAHEDRVRHLLATPAAHRWVSVEPMLGALDFEEYLPEGLDPTTNCGGCEVCGYGGDEPYLDAVVIGGESGPGYRDMNPEWARSLIAQCEAAGVPVMLKQLSGTRPEQCPELDGRQHKEVPWKAQ